MTKSEHLEDAILWFKGWRWFASRGFDAAAEERSMWLALFAWAGMGQ